MFGGHHCGIAGESVSPSSADSPDSGSGCPSGCESGPLHSSGCRHCWARRKSSRSSGLVALGKGASSTKLHVPLPSASFPFSAQAQRLRRGPFPRPDSAQWTSVPELVIGPGLSFTWAPSSSGDGAAPMGTRVPAGSSQHNPSCLWPVGDTIKWRALILESPPFFRSRNYQQELWSQKPCMALAKSLHLGFLHQ